MRRSEHQQNRPRAAARPTFKAVDEFTFEAALLFLRMTVAARDYLGQGRHPTGRRSILRTLGRDGPQTVPEMARARAVSRQHIQKMIDELRTAGLVKTIPNPAHRRSRRVALTAAGERFLDALVAREVELFAFLAKDIPLRDFRTATRVVRALRSKLESEAWVRLAGAGTSPKARRGARASGRSRPR